jgi:tetratricopeptide (TPR) repeat protein
LNISEGKVRVLNNLACSLYGTWETRIALEYCPEKPELAQGGPVKKRRNQYNRHDRGNFFAKWKEYDQAKSHLQNAKQLAENYGRDIGYLYILVDLGGVFLAQNEYEEAEKQLFLALDPQRQNGN